MYIYAASVYFIFNYTQKYLFEEPALISSRAFIEKNIESELEMWWQSFSTYQEEKLVPHTWQPDLSDTSAGVYRVILVH